MSEIFEMCMLIAFGFAWPTSIVKSWRARTTAGKSLAFLIVVLVGYVCGILSKIAEGHINYVIVFYCLNFLMVVADLALYFRNQALDRKASGEMEVISERK